MNSFAAPALAPLAVALALAAASTAASAHTVWLEPDAAHPGDYSVMFGGHQGKTEGYPPAKLKSIEAFDAKGRKLAVKRNEAADSVSLHVAGHPALIAMYFNNGIFSTTPEGRSVNTPMDQTPGAKKAVDAQKFSKNIVTWTPLVTRRLGQALEVVPLSATEPQAGQPMRVLVLANGKPVKGIKLGRGEDNGSEMTDAKGIATFTPVKGFNKLWAGQRTPIANDPHRTELSYEYLLGFDAQ